MIRARLLVGAAVAGLTLAAAPQVFAADESLPAVSAMNGKIEIGGGGVAHKGYGYGQGSLSVPLGHRFGLQLDGMGGDWNGKSVEAGAVHLFARNPSLGLIGLYASYANSDAPRRYVYSYDTSFVFGAPSSIKSINGVHVAHVGPEVELYGNRWTLSARGGAEVGVGHHNSWDRAEVNYYFTDDFTVGVGQRYSLNRNLGFVEGEWQLPGLSRMSVFAEVAGDTGSDVMSMAGVRWYFGAGGKSLIRRHREDDPRSALPEDLFTLTHAAARQNVCHFEGSVVPCGAF